MAFLGIGAALAGSATLFGISVSGAIDFGVTLAASVGISLAAQALAGKPPANPTALANSGMQVTLQAAGDVPRSFPLGACATAGSLVYANTWGLSSPGGQDTPNAYLTQVIALSDLPGATLNGVWVNGTKITYPGTTDPSQPAGEMIDEYVKDGQPYLFIRYYDGTQTEADSFLTSSVSSTDRPYESTRVGTGVAYAIVTTLTNDTLFTGPPTLLFELGGIPLYDPTKDSTNGGTGSQVYSDPSTWGGDGDDLPAVQAYNVLRGIRYSGDWIYGLQKTVQANLPTINWNAQIGKCRATIAGASGDEPMYRSGGQVSVSTQPADMLDAIMTACQGKISEVGGTYKVHLGTPDAFSSSFTDDDILSTEDQTFTPFLTLADSVNGITGTYPDPAQAWQSTTAPPLYNSTFEAQDGSRRLLASTSFDVAPYEEQVQRLMRSALLAARRERSHVVVLPPPFWPLEPGDVVRWNSVRNGYVDKDFIVTAISDQGNCDISVSLQEIDPTDYDWDHDTDYKPPTIGGTTFPRPSPQGIVDWFAEGAIINDASGIPRRPAIALSWDGDMPGVVGVQYEVRLTSDASDVTRGRTDQLAAGTLRISQSLLPNTPYQARGQYLPSAPRDMLWSDWLDVTTPDIRFTIADFADELAAQLNAVENFDAGNIQKAIDTLAQLAQDIDALNWLDKKQQRSELDAVAGNAKASIAELQTVVVDNQTAFAEFQTEVSATFGPAFSSVSTVTSAVATLDGYAAASWGVTIDVDGNVSGLELVDGSDSVSAFTVTVDKFQVAAPGVAGGAVTPIFTVANVNGTPKTSLRGDMYADGTITVNALDVANLTAISAHFGSATVDGDITASNGVFEIDFSNGRITIFGP
jgi:hypothetical protein